MLKGYSNFSAEYAESHTEIVPTMRLQANRIVGRYDVNDAVSFSGNTVTLGILPSEVSLCLSPLLFAAFLSRIYKTLH